MFPAQMEFLARERQQTLLQSAEWRRLLKIVAAQLHTQNTTTGHKN